MITGQEEKELASGETVSIQYNGFLKKWEVACWAADTTGSGEAENRWYKEFADEAAARTEYDRWQ